MFNRRSQKTQEFLKSAVLDRETAAAFSTAAAIQLKKAVDGKGSQPGSPRWGGHSTDEVNGVIWCPPGSLSIHL